MNSHHRRPVILLLVLLTIVFGSFITQAPPLGHPWVAQAQTITTSTVQTASGPDLISKGQFAKGLDGWQTSSITGSPFLAAHPTPGNGVHLCNADRCHDELVTSVQLPSPLDQMFLSYQYKVVTAETSRVCNDRMKADLRTSSGALIQTVAVACNFATNGWVQERYDVTGMLTQYAGQVVQVAFVGANNDSLPTDFEVDNVHLLAHPQKLDLGMRPVQTPRQARALARRHVSRPRRSGLFHNQLQVTQNPIQNGGFESQPITPWTVQGTAVGVTTSTKSGGSYSFQFCGGGTSCNGGGSGAPTVSQPINLPGNIQSATLNYWVSISSSTSGSDCLTPAVTVSQSVYPPASPLTPTCGNTSGWQYVSQDVTGTVRSYGDYSARVNFSTASGTGSSPNIYLDDVSLQVMSTRLDPGQKGLIDNGTFDTGLLFPWNLNSNQFDTHIDPYHYHSAYYSLGLCNGGYTNCDDAPSEPLMVPTGYQTLQLSFWMLATTTNPNPCADALTVTMRQAGMQLIGTVATFCGQNTSNPDPSQHNWVHQTYDLTSMLSGQANQEIRLQFEDTSSTGTSPFWLDDIQMLASGPTPAAWTGDTNANSGTPAWWSFHDLGLNPWMGLGVNVANGNLAVDFTHANLPGVSGFDQNLGLHYNSFARNTKTDVGNGWGLNTSRDVGLDLSVANQATFHDGSGYIATFTTTDGVHFTTPPGLNAQLQVTIDGIYVLTDNGSGEQLQFDPRGYLIAEQSRAGQRIGYTYNYDTAVSPSSIRNTEGQLTLLYANSNGLSRTYFDPSANTFTYTYDTAGNLHLVTVPGPNGTTGTFTLGYDSYHDLISISDPKGNVTQIAYVGSGSSAQVASITRVCSAPCVTATWNFTYTSGSTQVRDPNSHTTTYAYDARSRVTGVTDANSHTTTTGWTGNNDVSSVGLPSGHTTTYIYSTDGRNNLTQVLLPTGAATTYSYTDTFWPYQATSATDPTGNQTSFRYRPPNATGQGQVDLVTAADGTFTSLSYYKDGNVDYVSDARNINNNTYYQYANYNLPNWPVALPQSVVPPAPLGVTSCGGFIGANNAWINGYDGTDQCVASLQATETLGHLETAAYNALGAPTSIGRSGGERAASPTATTPT